MKTIVRVRKRPGEFVTLHKGFLSDARLGLDAMGLMTWLLAKPDDWTVMECALITSTGSSRGRVRAAMRTLEQCNYMRRVKIRDTRTGHFVRWERQLFETPTATREPELEQLLLYEQPEPRRNGEPPCEATSGPRKAGKEQKPRFQQNTPLTEKPLAGDPESGNPQCGNPQGGGEPLLTTKTNNDSLRTTTDTPRRIASRSDRFPAGAGGSVARVATPAPSLAACAVDDRDAVVVEEGEDLVSSLVCEACFPIREAQKLIETHGEANCARGLACLAAAAKRPRNVRAWLVDAIRKEWEPSSEARPARRLQRTVVPDPVSEAQRVKEQAEHEAMNRTLALLSEAEWIGHVAELRPRFGETVCRLLDGGRRASSINSIRLLVYEGLCLQSRQPSGPGVRLGGGGAGLAPTGSPPQADRRVMR